MKQMPDFIHSSFPNRVCRLKNTIYGLKQAPWAWFQRFTSFFRIMVLLPALQISRCSLATHLLGLFSCMLMILLSLEILPLLRLLSVTQEFTMKDLGTLHYFLSIEVTCYLSGFYLTPHKYAHQPVNYLSLMVSC